MRKILNFALKIKGVVGRVAHAKSSDPATPQKFGTCIMSKYPTLPNSEFIPSKMAKLQDLVK